MEQTNGHQSFLTVSYVKTLKNEGVLGGEGERQQ